MYRHGWPAEIESAELPFSMIQRLNAAARTNLLAGRIVWIWDEPGMDTIPKPHNGLAPWLETTPHVTLATRGATEPPVSRS
jgi:hypothetical protein